VFAGGFTLESAQRVASDEQIDEWDVLEHLGALVDKSLVLAEGEPLPRYRFLETTRLFALEQLAAAQETAVTLRGHAQAMVALIEDFERLRQRRYSTPAELAQLALEADNVRAALDWLQQADERASDFDDLAVELGGLAGHVLESSSGALEAFERTLALRTRLSAATPPASAARYWSMLADLGVITGREESLDAARRGEALYARLLDDEGRFRCLVALIAIGARRGAAASIERDVAEAGRIEPARPEARIYFRWARYRWLMALGRPEEALTCILERAAIAREAGMLAQEQFILGDTAADCELALGRIDAAEAYSRDALQVLERESGTRRLTAHVLDTLARALVAKGCHDAAIDTARRALQLTRNEGYHFRLLEPLALNAARHGRPKDAAWITGHVDAIYAERGEVRWPDAAARRTALDAVVCAALTRQEIDGLRAAGAVAAIDAAFERALGAPLK
jgi:tetratricopeptide (TPR) repeat protein